MKLDEYMSLNALTDVALAAKVGVASTTVMRWRRGTVRPDWEVLPRIVEATEGAVTANDFMPPVYENGGK